MNTDILLKTKFVKYLFSFIAQGIYPPNRLILLLFICCLMLFIFFVTSPPKYNNFEPLFSKRQLKVEALRAQEESSESTKEERKIAFMVLSMEKDGKIPDVDDYRRILLMRERVGMNILIRSGYLKDASFVTVFNENLPPYMQYKVVLDDAPHDCANLGAEASEEDLRKIATWLAISAVAVEKFHRNVLHRWIEWAYAQVFSYLSSERLPDVSFGPAQIRVSSVWKIATDIKKTNGSYSILLDMSDAKLKQILFDECESLKLAAIMMYYFLTKAHCKYEDFEYCHDYLNCLSNSAAADYIGHRRKTSAVIDYSPIVTVMAKMISENSEDWNNFQICTASTRTAEEPGE